MSDTQAEADGPWRMTAVKWSLLAAWILASYFLSFLVIVVLDDRNMLSVSWIDFLEILYAPVIWLYSSSAAFKSFVDGIVNLCRSS